MQKFANVVRSPGRRRIVCTRVGRGDRRQQLGPMRSTRLPAVPSRPPMTAIQGQDRDDRLRQQPLLGLRVRGAETANEVLDSRDGEVSWIVARRQYRRSDRLPGDPGRRHPRLQRHRLLHRRRRQLRRWSRSWSRRRSRWAPTTPFSNAWTTLAASSTMPRTRYTAGKNAAAELIKAVGDKAGKVGIIVSQFTAPGSEQRRKGFIEGLKGSQADPGQRGCRGQEFGWRHASMPPRISLLRPADLVAHLCDGRWAVRRGPGGQGCRQAGLHQGHRLRLHRREHRRHP